MSLANRFEEAAAALNSMREQRDAALAQAKAAELSRNKERDARVLAEDQLRLREEDYRKVCSMLLNQSEQIERMENVYAMFGNALLAMKEPRV